MFVTFPGRHRPKETARVPKEEQQAAGQSKHRDCKADDLDSAMGECRLLRLLQERLSRHDAYLYPLCGDQLLLSQPGGFTRTLPDLRAARQLLKQWEAR